MAKIEFMVLTGEIDISLPDSPEKQIEDFLNQNGGKLGFEMKWFLWPAPGSNPNIFLVIFSK